MNKEHSDTPNITPNLINSISNTYVGNKEEYLKEYKELADEARARLLEEELINICDSIVKCTALTKDKHIDIDLLLQIVASYLIGTEQGELDSDVPPPRVLFEDNLVGTLDSLPDNPEVITEDTSRILEDTPDDREEHNGDRLDTSTIDNLGT